ncbi:unnamed protein product [Nezara viridula]|uniref:Uncharacterized protein n=1 Tax=Nezara viridula TaxID=85310 RepID=A0A9P0MLD8_NEZVI|nr:unnamed protein product [Nezara viridula]
MDEALCQIGQSGPYQQLLLYFVLLPCVLPCSFHAYSQLFMSSSPEHWCAPPPHLRAQQNIRESLSCAILQNVLGPIEDGPDRRDIEADKS